MDHTKTQTFVAFINKEKKNKYWINGNWVFDDEVPKIYPYETKEQKEIADLAGFRCSCWEDITKENSEVIAVLLKVTDKTVPIISKEKFIAIEEKLFGKSIFSTDQETPVKKKKSKEDVEKVEEPIPKPILEKPKKEIKQESKEQIQQQPPEIVPKKRGRPRIHNLLED